MHSEIVSVTPGSCPKCGMTLILKSEIESKNSNNPSSFKPLLIIVGLILVAAATPTIISASPNWVDFGRYFMAGFFLVFSGFKLLDLKGFAEGYTSYDLLARRVFKYGYIYPFLELLIGLSLLKNFQPFYINLFTLLLMLFSGLGVVIALSQKRQFQCACLGTIIKVPLTYITLIEDFGMAIMAALMLFI